MSTYARRARLSLIGLIVGVSVFILILWQLDWTVTSRSLGQALANWVAVAIGCALLVQVLNFAKMYFLQWQANITKSLRAFVPIYSSITVGGVIIPFRSGEIVASLIWKGAQGKLLAMTLLNRWVEGTLTFILAAVTLAFFVPPTLVSTRWALVVGALIVCMLIAYFLLYERFGLWALRVLGLVCNRLLPVGIMDRVRSRGSRIEEELRIFYSSTRTFVQPSVFFVYLVLTLLLRALSMMTTYSLFRAVRIELSFAELFGVLIANWIGTFVAPTPAGIGVGDIPPVLFLSAAGHTSGTGAFLILSRCFDLMGILLWSGLGLLMLRRKQLAVPAISAAALPVEAKHV